VEAALAAVGQPLAAVLACRLVSFWAVVAGGWVVFFFLRRRDRLSRQAQDGLPSAEPEPGRKDRKGRCGALPVPIEAGGQTLPGTQ
jgi:hypothetical protein